MKLIGFQRATLAAAVLFAGASAAFAGEHVVGRHHHARNVHAVPPFGTYGGGRLVMNPSFNIACQTRDRATRALPCDQPVWVYGSPCEIDLGLGRWRNCDDPLGVVHGGAHHRSW